MNHATDSLLLAYHDGEVDGSALAELRDHLASCAQCTRDLAELRRMSERVSEVLALTDVPAPALRPAGAAAVPARPARRRVAAWHWLGTSSLAKAALFLLALAGVLTAIPGTPPRRAVELLLARLFDRAPAVEPVAAPPGAAVPTVRELSVDPADGQVRVLVHGASAVDVTVRLVDAPKARVETSAVGQQLRWISANGRAEISGLHVGSLRVDIPRAVDRATIEFDGRVAVRLSDGVLQLEGPAGSARGDAVSFRISQ